MISRTASSFTKPLSCPRELFISHIVDSRFVRFALTKYNVQGEGGTLNVAGLFYQIFYAVQDSCRQFHPRMKATHSTHPSIHFYIMSNQ